jgi:hypothetical protein
MTDTHTDRETDKDTDTNMALTYLKEKFQIGYGAPVLG